jgi:hypothetical protein
MGWMQILAQQEHYKDMLHEAERVRTAHLVLAALPEEPARLEQSLVWLGRQLVKWGQGLERRYQVPAEAAPLTGVDC